MSGFFDRISTPSSAKEAPSFFDKIFKKKMCVFVHVIQPPPEQLSFTHLLPTLIPFFRALAAPPGTRSDESRILAGSKIVAVLRSARARQRVRAFWMWRSDARLSRR